MRVVIDSNIWVSYLINPGTPFQETVDTLLGKATVLYSDATLQEVLQVLLRPKFRCYVDIEDAYDFAARLSIEGELVDTPAAIKACRDPADDKFLDLAVSGKADMIVTGDADLLALDPFRGIAILRPGEALRRLKI